MRVKLFTVHSHGKKYSSFEIISEVVYFHDFGIMMFY